MNCWTYSLAILNIFVIHISIVLLCCSSGVSLKEAAAILNDSTRISVSLRHKREISCKCTNSWGGPCVPEKCTCDRYGYTYCHTEEDFCKYKACFGKTCERMYGSSLCHCLNGQWCDRIVQTSLHLNTRPIVLVDVAPEVGELQHCYVFPYLWNQSSTVEHALVVDYQSTSGLTFRADLRLLHHRPFEYALPYSGRNGKVLDSTPTGNKTRSTFYAFWMHYPSSDKKLYAITLSLEGLVNWKHWYTVRPIKLPGKCYPKLTIRNCGNASATPTVWKAGKTHTLYTTQEGQCYQSMLTSTLSIYKLGKSRRTPPWPVMFRLETLETWDWDFKDNRYKTIVQDSKNFNLDSKDLKYGLNAAVLEVLEIPVPFTGMRSGKNVVMCFFKVEPLPKVAPIPTGARISGGRKVDYNNGRKVVMDGTVSSNPNAPRNRQMGSLGFSWSCWDKNNPKDTSVCKGPDVEIATDAVFTPNFTLVLFTPYEFQLTTFDQKWGDETNATNSKAVQTVKVTYTEPVRAVIKGGTDVKYERVNTIVLDSEGTYNPNAPFDKQWETLGFSWSCWDKDNPKDTSVCKGPDVEIAKNYRFTPSFELDAFRPYVFQLTAFDRTLSQWTLGTHGKAVQTVTVNAEPVKAVIKGGTEMKYGRENTIVLDSEGTYNPNVPRNKQKESLGFSWSCWDKDNPKDKSVCKGPDVEISKKSVFTPSFKLDAFRPYVFQLTAFDKTLSKWTHGTHGKAVQTVTVNFEPVKAVIKGGTEVKYGRENTIVLDSEGTYNPNVPRNKQKESLGFSWSCWDKDNPKDESVCKGADTELSKEAVFVPNFKLDLFRPYVFQLTAFDRTVSRWSNGTHSKAEQTVTITFKVESVVCVIKGGNWLEFKRGEKVVVDSEGTYNPNAPRDKQKETLGYSWSCWDRDDPSDTSVCKGPGIAQSEDPVFLANLNLVEARPYVFQLKAFDKTLNITGHPTDDTEIATVEVVLPEVTTRLDITFCEDMCGCSAHKAQAGEIIVLEASCLVDCPSVPTYKWDIRPKVSLTGNTVFEPSDKLAIKGNVLTEGKTYNISVIGGEGAFAKRTLTINQKPSPGQCEVTPQSGNVEDLFTVKCTGFKDEDFEMPMTYRVYQDDASDADWQWLIAVEAVKDPWTLRLSGLQLMAGQPAKFVVKAGDYYGAVTSVTVSLEIGAPNGGWTIETIKRLFDRSKVERKSDNEKVQTVFMLTDALSKLPVEDEEDDVVLAKFKMKKTFLQWLDDVQLNDGTDVEQITNAVGTMLKKNQNIPMHHENARLASALTLKLTKKLQEAVNNGRQFGCLSEEDIQKITKSLVHSSIWILDNINIVDHAKDKSSEQNKDKLYPDYTDLETDTIERENNKHLASKDALEALDILGIILSKNQADSTEDNTIVTDSIIIWSKTGQPCALAEKYIPGSTNITGPCQTTTVYISKPLCQHLETIAKLIKLKVIIFKNNPQSFKADSDKLNAEFVSIGMTPFEMNKGRDIKSIAKLAHPIDIFLMLKQNYSGAVGDIKSLDQGSVKAVLQCYVRRELQGGSLDISFLIF